VQFQIFGGDVAMIRCDTELLVLVLACSQAQANPARLILECDRLAASNIDQDRLASVPGVPPNAIDATVAVPACEAAAKVAPEDRRILFQLGRALRREGLREGAPAI
jgi:hypothetical protein